MKHFLNPQVQSIQISGIHGLAERMQTMKDVVSLTVGEPNFHTPFSTKEAGKQAIDDDFSYYAPTNGVLKLRSAASDFLLSHYGLRYNPHDEIIVTNGSTGSIFIALKTLLTEGDEVLIPTPTYPGYEPAVTLSGGKLVYMDVSENSFKLSREILEQYISEKTKVLILPFPSNPTGAIMTKEELDELVPVLEKYPCYIISDELYSELVYDQPHASIASYPSLRDKTIVINGLSKSHAMTGWRIGFTFAPPYLTEEMAKVHQYLNTSVNTMAQFAGYNALRNNDQDVLNMKEEYRKRRDYVCERLNQLGFETTVPDSTFYVFPHIGNLHSSATQLCYDLLEHAKVGILPSTVMTGGDDRHFRISYSYSMEKIEEAMNRMEQYLLTRTK